MRERVRQLKDREKKAIRAKKKKKAARELEVLQMEQLREEFELERRETPKTSTPNGVCP